MIFWILLGIIVVSTIAIVFYNSYWYFAVDVLIGCLLIGGLILVAYMVIAHATMTRYDDMANQRVASTTTYPLQALNTGSETSGAFFLGSGTIDDELTFSYIYKDDGAFRLKSTPARDAFVRESDTTTPRIVTTNYEAVNDSMFWLPWEVAGHWGTTVEFYVPTGSVLNNYTVAP